MPANASVLAEPGAPELTLEAAARALAQAQSDLSRAPRLLTRFLGPPSVASALKIAQRHLSCVPTGNTALPKAAEWFLDNFYLIRRVARQVEEELPRGFVRHLPQLARGPSRGALRIDALARAFVSRSRLELDLAGLQRFLCAYQEVSPLTIAELWALPTFLRASVLQHLVALLAALHVPLLARDHLSPEGGDPSGAGPSPQLQLDPSAGVERSIYALRLLESIDWKSLFERSNRVEAILRQDPARIYAQMDFETCDAYRKGVESVAWDTGYPEQDVAELAVKLAAEGSPDERRGHVGFYLVGAGRRALETRLGQRTAGLESLRRAILRWPTAAYLAPLLTFTLGPLLVLGALLARHSAHPLEIAAALLIASLPVSIVAAAFLQSAFARILPPRTLPKLDYSKGIPDERRTLVVIPTLLGRPEEIEELARQLELHYLSNPDKNLQFALLTDDLDATEMRDDPSLFEAAAAAVTALNARHAIPGKSSGPFHLLHRAPRWNPSEGRFMGWERKRGKLEELNRLLRGDTSTSYVKQVGDPAGLRQIRYVLTLDSDTQLPMGCAARLVGLLAHPLNRALFDPRTGRVVAGYTIVQPRVETSPASSRQTRFSRIFAGDIGFDIYTHACSELYQDLFGSGIYVGKGLYEVDAFTQSLEGRAPENALVSHDLFEGIHGRAALATDIVLFEGYPTNYIAYAKRMHRWVRGDWQLLRWLFPWVPSGLGARLPNSLALIDRWKIFDNLRRSLTAPLLFLLVASGVTWLPGSALLWVAAGLLILVAPQLPALLFSRRMRWETAQRCGLAVAFLAYEACVVSDAVARVLVRTLVTKKGLLEWTTAAQTAHGLHLQSPRALAWRTMWPSALLAALLCAATVLLHPNALPVALLLCLLWALAPEIARAISAPLASRAEPLSPAQRRQLRLLARRTWRFFDAFVGPNDQWLPVDNHQEEPNEQTAHRTSPTNIGLLLTATLSAYDFGYIGPVELSLRIRRTFESVARLQHYQGHLLNWYETRSLQPLLPRYVSTVDSGNFAGCLLALQQGCAELAAAPVVRAASWRGFIDAIDLLELAVASAPRAQGAELRRVLGRMREACERARDHLHESYAALRTLGAELFAELDRALHAFIEDVSQQHDAGLLHELRSSIDGFKRQLKQMRCELDALMPWLSLESEALDHAIDLPMLLRIDEIPAAARQLQAQLESSLGERRQRGDLTAQLQSSGELLAEAFRGAEQSALVLHRELLALAARADEEVRGMDFRLLYDGDRKLFRIGYNATLDQADPHYYDLLASEARLASYLAIVKRDVPESHWYALGRPMNRVAGAPALLSWGGTMFEYLMPTLLMRSREGTLLGNTYEQVVSAQIEYARDKQEPWGISESAYARLDAQQTYQYRSFGVPGLGFKRGLDEDRVITPYASLLALPVRPRAVVENLGRLEAAGMMGTYGLFEALDMTPERTPEGRSAAVVRSYMAHHQGMLLISLGNALTGRSMVERFHANPIIETGEMLLNEHAPDRVPKEWPVEKSAEPALALALELPRAPEPWSGNDRTRPQAFALSNGRMTTLVTDSGGGALAWNNLALTRYTPDATLDDQGLWIYLRDEQSRHSWLATSAEGRTTYSMHKAEYHRRDEGISVHVDIAVAPADDVEIRQVTLHNETDRARRFTVTSAGRPVLFDARQARSHPAFSSLFVESERLAELDALLFSRRTQSPEEESAVLVHRLVGDAGVALAGSETDRNDFYGRCARPHAPQALAPGRAPRHGRTGPVLDPVMSLTASVELKPKGSMTVAFVTSFARSRTAAVDLCRRYGSMHAVRWAFRDAEQEVPRRLQRNRIEPQLLPSIQRLHSALLFADPSLRAAPEGSPAQRACQRRLWSRGISGDEPILLVRVRDPAAQIVAEALAAQRLLRSCGVKLDLVLIDEQATGYQTEGSGTLRSVLAQNEATDWLNQRGGVYVIAADQIPLEERRHLEAAARVVLDTQDGSLAARMGRAAEPPPKLPRFEASVADEPVAGPKAARRAKQFDNGRGGFSEDGREYLIEVSPGQPTPAPWANVIANPEFGCLTSESSLGSSWSLNAGENRLTPWRNDPVFDTPSEVLYLRDEETAAIWSATPLPCGREGESRVRHGAGYTIYERESRGLVQELTIFVPPDAPLKIARLRLRNTSARQRRLTATYYAEWVLGSRREEQRPYIASEFDRDSAALLASCQWNAEFGDRVAFLASAERVHGFTTDRTEFLGLRGDYARPEVLARWGMSGSVAPGVDPCAALQVHLEIAAGAEVETHFILGEASSRAEAAQLIARYRQRPAVDEAFSRLGTFWDGLLGNIQVKTPEPAMDLMLNRWLLYQTTSARLFGRTGFYQSSGAFGYRDQLQDVLALLHAAPERARAHILESARHQFEEGDVLHWWHPPSGRGVRTRCSDDLAWLPYVAAEYVAATGDIDILREPVAMLRAEPLKPDEKDRYAQYEPSPDSPTLMEHCRRALEHALTSGPHGLPLMGDGDWNDGMNLVGAEGVGESVWLGWFLCATMERFAGLLVRVGDPAGAGPWRARASGLRARLRASAWDGSWYLRAFHDDGSLVGSAKSRECRIDSIAQSWAVLAGDGRDDPQARQAVASADAELVRETERLILLFWPPFDGALHDPGYIRGYPSGIRENGGQYTHAAAWLGFAHASLGEGDKSERLFRLLNPALRATSPADAMRYRVEPYALAGDIYSCEPWVGRGGWSWYTGAAAWTWRLGIEAILGLKMDDGGLRIDPCIPSRWSGFEAWVRLGRQELHVVVENPGRAQRGIAQITLDGALLSGNRVALDRSLPGKHELRVRMGS